MDKSDERLREEMDAAQAEIDTGVRRYIDQLPVPTTLEEANAEREFWIIEACRFSRNEDYYRGLVERIGRALGDEAYIADDGSRSQDVLCDKIPELVEAALAASNPLPCVEGITDAKVEAGARAIFETQHKGLRSCHGFDDHWEHNEYLRPLYYRDARACLEAALSAPAPERAEGR